MNYRLKLSACAFALAFGVPAVASAQGLNGLNYTLDGHYGQFDVPGPGSSVDDWGFGGAVSAPVADAFSLQGNAAFDRHSNSGAHLSTWNLAGSGLFNFGQGRVAGTLGYNTYRGAGTNFDAFAYGVGAEFYAADQLTIAVRGGGISPNHGIKDGSYFGGALTGYVMPDLGVTGTLN